MFLRKMSVVCNRRVLMMLFYFHLVLLGVILIIAYDINTSPKETEYLKAYNRWKAIRDDFDSYSKQRAQKDAYLQIRGRQMDAVAGFDLLNGDSNDKIKLSNNGSVDERVYASSAINPLNFIPKVPEYSQSDIVPYLSSNITRKYLALPRAIFTHKIVILTPVCDVAHVLNNYMKQLAKLSYPHDLLSVYLGEDSSTDRTLDMATLIADDLKSNYGFHDAAAYHFNFSGGVHGAWGDVHHRASQYERRAHIAKSRNMLLKIGLARGEFDYVLWIDSDVKQLPADLIQQLLFAKSDVVVPSCLFQSGDYKRTFDKNSWRETPASIEDQEHLPKDILIVEGYSISRRIYLPDLKAEGRIVRLDGVGGCALLIKASCHRRGLKFPERVYTHHIETEGLAKMADHMGFTVVGVPFVEVFHN
ncbi:uncharacterized protein LOC123534147 [Mercenaria mercenaria]|uniref:uncharacterized protein LOC123534147 n=1 Tax=Mercenaria mercenaria TaxID=6596 RepID=UPI00234F8C9B|nr:uncharacterized protein LOC123534147 [Mercenaria mercenaria]XP_053376210.1 uncharacterized protein LOC123534147 [Mercenaria mercenaria]